MLRLTFTLDADSENDIVAALHHAADRFEEGYTSVDLRRDGIESGTAEIEKLCEYCDGTGETTQGKGEDAVIKKCFNCNGPDYDAMREGK